MQRDWDAHGQLISGGMPYAEGIYLDMNQVGRTRMPASLIYVVKEGETKVSTPLVQTRTSSCARSRRGVLILRGSTATP